MKTSLFLTALAACGGGDDGSTPDAAAGVAKSTLINALTSTEITAECKYLLYTYPPTPVTCSDSDTTIGYASQSACVSSITASSMNIPDCQATVGDVEDCLSTEYALSTSQYCDQTDLPVSCARLASADCNKS
jgi:hypothetical protein